MYSPKGRLDMLRRESVLMRDVRDLLDLPNINQVFWIWLLDICRL